MLGSSEMTAFVGVTDIDQATNFYRDALGLKVLDAGSGHCVLDADGSMLRLTLIANLINVDYTVVGWNVAEIAKTCEDLAARGVVFQRFDGIEQDDSGVWVAPDGDRIAWFLDPDANILSITQFA
ncbi:MAG: VOC family protein [Actinobacteria bacterium]|nr:VOC family protein [Actinomycetota bacterium]